MKEESAQQSMERDCPPLAWSLEEMRALRDKYKGKLLNDTIPFWFPRAIDNENGGYFTCLDQDGTLLQSDKSIWFQGRMAWMLSTLYLTVERRKEWLDAAEQGIRFLNQYGFDADGRMFFSVTKDGRPLRKRRYIFSECFAVIALAAFGAATDQPPFIRQAEQLFELIIRYHRTPGLTPDKVNREVRPMKGLAMPMILIVTAQELRKYSQHPLPQEVINASISEIERDFLNPEYRCLLETIGPQGEFIDNFDGRCINPGHSLEAGWFILEEARLQKNRPDWIALGTTIIDWSLELGWDREHGGLYYFRDAKGLPCTEYWHDMKFWWPHNEGIIATLLAHLITGNANYADWHRKIDQWSDAHFPDKEHGEWFGYLHRDGTLSTRIKGSMFKGFFHLPRMQWYCAQRLDEALSLQVMK